MSNVAHMPAHKALNIDKFHDATVKVGMYKNPVTAFMHPYTLGALETSVRKTGGVIENLSDVINVPGPLFYRGVELIARDYWSKDDVTFCVDQAAGLKDAIARGVLKVQDWQKSTEEDIRRALNGDGTFRLEDDIKMTARAHVADRLAEIETATLTDVTGELELSKAVSHEVPVQVSVHGAAEAASQLGTIAAAAVSTKAAIESAKAASQELVTVHCTHLASTSAEVGTKIRKLLDKPNAVTPLGQLSGGKLIKALIEAVEQLQAEVEQLKNAA